MTKRYWLLLLISQLLAACGQGTLPGGPTLPTPSTPVPNELVGSWFTGDLANIDYYDPYTGSWSDPGGYGIYFSFNEDGSYEHGAVFSSTVYSCTTKVLSFEKGTVEVGGETLLTHLQTGQASWSNTCGENGENAYGPEDTTWTWSLGSDAYGQETLTLVKTDGSLRGDFQRWDRE